MKCYQTIVSGGRNPNPPSPTPTPSLTGPSPANPSSPATNTLTVSPANPTQEITRPQLASQLLRALLASERDPSASAFARFVARFGIDAEWSLVPIPGRAHALEASQINRLLAKIETGVPIHQALTENHLSINQFIRNGEDLIRLLENPNLSSRQLATEVLAWTHHTHYSSQGLSDANATGRVLALSTVCERAFNHHPAIQAASTQARDAVILSNEGTSFNRSLNNPVSWALMLGGMGLAGAAARTVTILARMGGIAEGLGIALTRAAVQAFAMPLPHALVEGNYGRSLIHEIPYYATGPILRGMAALSPIFKNPLTQFAIAGLVNGAIILFSRETDNRPQGENARRTIFVSSILQGLYMHAQGEVGAPLMRQSPSTITIGEGVSDAWARLQASLRNPSRPSATATPSLAYAGMPEGVDTTGLFDGTEEKPSTRPAAEPEGPNAVQMGWGEKLWDILRGKGLRNNPVQDSRAFRVECDHSDVIINSNFILDQGILHNTITLTIPDSVQEFTLSFNGPRSGQLHFSRNSEGEFWVRADGQSSASQLFQLITGQGGNVRRERHFTEEAGLLVAPNQSLNHLHMPGSNPEQMYSFDIHANYNSQPRNLTSSYENYSDNPHRPGTQLTPSISSSPNRTGALHEISPEASVIHGDDVYLSFNPLQGGNPRVIKMSLYDAITLGLINTQQAQPTFNDQLPLFELRENVIAQSASPRRADATLVESPSLEARIRAATRAGTALELAHDVEIRVVTPSSPHLTMALEDTYVPTLNAITSSPDGRVIVRFIPSTATAVANALRGDAITPTQILMTAEEARNLGLYNIDYNNPPHFEFLEPETTSPNVSR